MWVYYRRSLCIIFFILEKDFVGFRIEGIGSMREEGAPSVVQGDICRERTKRGLAEGDEALPNGRTCLDLLGLAHLTEKLTIIIK